MPFCELFTCMQVPTFLGLIHNQFGLANLFSNLHFYDML